MTSNPVTDNATPSQIERANAAVEANLNEDGSPRYDSAQGYACALTAIIATDAMQAAHTPPSDDVVDLCARLRKQFSKVGFGLLAHEAADTLERLDALLSQQGGEKP